MYTDQCSCLSCTHLPLVSHPVFFRHFPCLLRDLQLGQYANNPLPVFSVSPPPPPTPALGVSYSWLGDNNTDWA